MKHCQQCNQSFADDFSYCLSCGNLLREISAAVNAARETTRQETFVRCPQCRNFVQSDARVCEHCGTLLRNVDSSASSRPEPPPTQYVQPPQSQPSFDISQRSAQEPAGFRSDVPPGRVATPTSPVRNDQTTPSSSNFQPYGTAQATRPSSFRWWHALILLVFFLGFIGALGVGGWWWWSNSNQATNVNNNSNESERIASTNATDDNNQPETSSSPPTSSSQSEPTVSDNSADAELKRLQQTVNDGNSSGGEILAAIANAEEKYPSDYHFTYERAKLIGKGLITHDEGWAALRRAAEKAIDNNQAEEMLSDIKSRAQTDFRKLSTHNDEWNAIIKGLESHDKAALKHAH